MGAAYKATDTRLGRIVAVKILKREHIPVLGGKPAPDEPELTANLSC